MTLRRPPTTVAQHRLSTYSVAVSIVCCPDSQHSSSGRIAILDSPSGRNCAIAVKKTCFPEVQTGYECDLCKYVIKICFVSAPSSVFSGALVDCSETVPNRHLIAKLNEHIVSWSRSCNCFCSWLWRHVQPQANHSTPTVLPQRIPASASMIIDNDWPSNRIGRQIASVDAPVTSTQSSWTYSGALWCKQFATSCRILNLIRCTAGCQCRLSLINVDTGANFGNSKHAFKILWTRSVCTVEIPDRAELQYSILVTTNESMSARIAMSLRNWRIVRICRSW